MAKATAKRPRLSREEQKKIRTQELLDAAWTLFCEKGYEDLTIDELAEFAGYSRMPIYSLFGDKQNLFFELWRTRLEELKQHMLAPCEAGAPVAVNLRKLADLTAVDSNQDEPPHGNNLFFVVQTICLNRPDLLAKLTRLSQSVIDVVADMIGNCQLEAGQSLRAPPKIIASHIVAHINGSSTVQYQTQQKFIDADYLYDIFIELTIGGRPHPH